MGKIAVLFVLAGLAVGLWLGFNPAAHREVVRLWSSATASAATNGRRGETTTTFSLRSLDARVARFFRSTPSAEVTPKSQPGTANILTQISTLFQDIWHALQRIWLSLVAHTNKASH